MSSHIDSDTGTEFSMTSAVTLQTLAASGDQPGWRVLDTARTQQFTGEITFRTQPSISVYFDGGVAYHAVRAGDPSLCTSLVDAGVVQPAQVERGVVRVGNVENLGRLFDRDASIDRDAVMVVLELATDQVVTAIANTVSGPFALTAYRHHVSGVHRWFVSPGEPPAQLTPVGEVAQIDDSVTGNLPGLAVAQADDGVQIEWNQPIPNQLDAVQPIHVMDEDLLSLLVGDIDRPASMNAPVGAPVSLEDLPSMIDSPSAPVIDPATQADVAPAVDPKLAPALSETKAEPDHDLAAPAPGVSTADGPDDFQILWPDGSEQHLTDIDINTIDDSTDQIVEAQEAPVAPAAAVTFDPPVDVESAAVDAPSSLNLTFEMPSLALTADNEPDEQQPEEVVDAVRRALDAIEAASSGPAHLPSVAVGSLPAVQQAPSHQFDVVHPLAHDTGDATVAASSITADPGVSVPDLVRPPEESTEIGAMSLTGFAAGAGTAAPIASAAPASLGGFAPPTANDSAEAVYARAAAAVQQPLAEPPAEVTSVSSVTSVVFVDDAADEADDRSGALKRLIGSLRRK